MEGRLDQVRRWLGRIFNFELGRIFNFELGRIFNIELGRIFNFALGRIFNLQLWRIFNFELPSLQSIDSSSLPPATRQKLHSIFGLIEKEFEVSPFHDDDYGYDDG